MKLIKLNDFYIMVAEQDLTNYALILLPFKFDYYSIQTEHRIQSNTEFKNNFLDLKYKIHTKEHYSLIYIYWYT